MEEKQEMVCDERISFSFLFKLLQKLTSNDELFLPLPFSVCVVCCLFFKGLKNMMSKFLFLCVG